MTTQADYSADWAEQLAETIKLASNTAKTHQCGRISKAVGLVLEAVGIQVPVGATCLIEVFASKERKAAPHDGEFAEAEVVGFSNETLYLMPLDEVHGLQNGARVYPKIGRSGEVESRKFPLGTGLLGRVLDGGGSPLDDKGKLRNVHYATLATEDINPLKREPIHEQIDVGIRAINGLLSIGRGQRMGLFAGSGVGKSVLLGMMARYTDADVVVVGLIGERGREVQEFIQEILGEAGLNRSVVVAAPADAPPLKRLQGAAYATRLAEDFRDEGKNVLLIMDSLTRYAMAQREIALAIGEPPATKGYPPSVFAKLPRLVERAGNAEKGHGSITAFYTVLTEGDDQQDPIADSARAILDGHIVLSRQLADSGHYPAIDIEASISRVMTAVTAPEHQSRAQKLKQMHSKYMRSADAITYGAYAAGRDQALDTAVQYHSVIERFLQQSINEQSDIKDTLATLNAIIR